MSDNRPPAYIDGDNSDIRPEDLSYLQEFVGKWCSTPMCPGTGGIERMEWQGRPIAYVSCPCGSSGSDMVFLDE